MFFLDGITELEEGISARGFWTPADEEAHFAGHFDGLPLLPGVKQVEALAQLGAYAVLAGNEEPMWVVLAGIKTASFNKPVRPGERLDLAIEITSRNRRDFIGRGIAEVNGSVVCQTELSGSVMKEKLFKRVLAQ
jgi:3-hydroxyacyl-[acyl-carrier-protein] dehydratase